MDNLLENRWKERDRDLDEKILAVQSEMGRRGILRSSVAVKEYHQVFRSEFQESKEVIVKTIVDSLKSKHMKFDRSVLEKKSIEMLAQRCDSLNATFLKRAEASYISLLNNSMIAPFMSLDQYFDHMVQELKIELNQALDEYESQFGVTLTDRIISSFKNRKLVAFGIIVMIVVMSILTFVNMIDEVFS